MNMAIGQCQDCIASLSVLLQQNVWGAHIKQIPTHQENSWKGRYFKKETLLIFFFLVLVFLHIPFKLIQSCIISKLLSSLVFHFSSDNQSS